MCAPVFLFLAIPKKHKKETKTGRHEPGLYDNDDGVYLEYIEREKENIGS